MLKFLRKKNIAKIVFWFLVILILPAFVFWGTGSLSGSKDKGPKSVGMINSKKISFEDFYFALNGVRCQVVLFYFAQPNMLDMMLQNKELMGKLAWDRLIMMKEADKAKLKVTDKEVVSFIQSHPIFNRDGAFDPKIYEHVLRYNIGLDARGFEEIVRENIRIKKLNDLIAKDIAATDEEILSEYKKVARKFRIEYILSPTPQSPEKTAVTDETAKDYYDKNMSEFALPVKTGEEQKFADFEGVKESIKSYLAERDSKTAALKNASEARQKIADVMSGENIPFGKAAEKIGLKTAETPFFSKGEYIDGLGEAMLIMDEISRLKEGEISIPTEVRSGAIIFRVSGSEDFTEEKFNKDKAEFAKLVTDIKKNKFLEAWLSGLEKQAVLNINLKEYEKYYR